MAGQETIDYDIFVSYRRRDNSDGIVDAFVEALVREHLRFSPTPLRVFFDRTAIATMQDWEHRILHGLRSSKVLLAIISPGYFESMYCRREWEIFLEHELDRQAPGEGVLPIYVEQCDAFEGVSADDWILNLRRRQYVDLRRWWPEGASCLARAEVRNCIARFDQVLADRLDRAALHAASPTTTPGHNRNFVGRAVELRKIRETLALGGIGRVTILQGIAGVGKSALAFEYAHAYAAEYPRGRFMVPVEGLDDLRLAMLRLAEPLGIILTDEERSDPEGAFLRIRGVLAQGPRTLLLLDNVNRPGLLSSHQISATLPASDRLHVLATTRLEPQLFKDAACFALDPLSERESVELMERYRACSNPQERDAAFQIARRLSGHPLALEIVGVFLWQNPEVRFAEYLARLEGEGIEALEGVGRDERIQLSRHTQTSLIRLLDPTLEALAPAERLAVRYAGLLPPDFVAVPWVRILVAGRFTQLRDGAKLKPGYPDPWRQVLRRLYGLRLLVPGSVPEIARMHRLIQQVVWPKTPRVSRTRRGLHDKIVAHACERMGASDAARLAQEMLWEMDALAALAEQLLDAGNDKAGARIANFAAAGLTGHFRFAESRLLLRHAIRVLEAAPEGDPVTLAVSLSILGMVESFLGEFQAAEELLRKSIDLMERSPQPNEVELSGALTNMARLRGVRGNHKEAQTLLRRAVELQGKNLGPDHPRLAVTLAELALLENAIGNSENARRLVARAIATAEKSLDGKHPVLARLYSDSSRIESSAGNSAGAKALLERSLAMREAALGGNHPVVADSCRELALIAFDSGNSDEARVLIKRAIDIFRNTFGDDHFSLAQCFHVWGYIEKNLGNHDGLRELLEKVVDITVRVVGPEHASLATRYADLGVLEKEAGNRARARVLLEKSLAVGDKWFGPDDVEQATTYAFLAKLEWDEGNIARALDLGRNAYRIWLQHLGPDHKFTRSAGEFLEVLEGPK